MRRHLILLALLASLTGAPARSESVYFPGVHNWAKGAFRDVMAWHTGWVTQFSDAGMAPNIQTYNDICGEGFTIIQRLDYGGDETVPENPADYTLFAAQCGNFANDIKDYCHIYTIGNEVDLGPVTPAQYAACFIMVRDAIKAVQPEALVLIGHWCSIGHVRDVMALLGPGGYDGLSAHFNGVPYDMMEALDDYGAPPHCGVYTTEWGWKRDSNQNAQADMTYFFNLVAGWNSTHSRQLFGKTWFVYSVEEWESFSLQIAQIDNPAFEYAITHTLPYNHYVLNQIQISDVHVHVNSQSQVTVTWQTDMPSTTQVWYAGEGALFGNSTSLDPTPRTQHTAVLGGLSGYQRYQAVLRSTGIGVGDAAEGPIDFVSGMSTAIVPYRIADGWNMVSVPLEAVDPEASAVFADQVAAGNGITGALHRYEPGAGYETYPYAFADMEIGKGYWLYLDNAVDNTTYGVRLWDPVTIPLAHGWNLVGHPSTDSVNWFGAVQVTDGGTTLDVEGAHATGWLDKTGYYYEGRYKTLGAQGTADDYKLRQWRAYWILTYQPGLELIIPTH